MSVDGPGLVEAVPMLRRPTLDPRIRERWIEARRREGRRRLRFLLAAFGLCLLVGVGWALTRSPLLDVDRVEVRGASHLSAATVTAVAQVRRGSPMTALDGGAVARRLGALPWVAHATIVRRWPATAVITVRERAPVAVVGDAKSGWALVDGTGRLLDRASPGAQPLPLLEGVDGVGLNGVGLNGVGLNGVGAPGTSLPPAASGLLRVAAALPPGIRTWVSAVASGDGGGVELRLKPEGVVRLGDPSRLAAQLQAVAAVLQQVDVHDLAVLDVQDPATPLLTRRGAGVKVLPLRRG